MERPHRHSRHSRYVTVTARSGVLLFQTECSASQIVSQFERQNVPLEEQSNILESCFTVSRRISFKLDRFKLHRSSYKTRNVIFIFIVNQMSVRDVCLAK